MQLARRYVDECKHGVKERLNFLEKLNQQFEFRETTARRSFIQMLRTCQST